MNLWRFPENLKVRNVKLSAVSYQHSVNVRLTAEVTESQGGFLGLVELDGLAAEDAR